jgi:hypothetical protein
MAKLCACQLCAQTHPGVLLTWWWGRCLAAACGCVKGVVLDTRTGGAGGAHVCGLARPGSALPQCRRAVGRDQEVALNTETAVVSMVAVQHLQNCTHLKSAVKQTSSFCVFYLRLANAAARINICSQGRMRTRQVRYGTVRNFTTRISGS